jgi:cyclopropane-fatty-acyl-phospholipid synthase
MNFKTAVDRTLRRIGGAGFTIEYWDGERVDYGSGKPRFILLVKSASVARGILRNPLVRLPEAYVDGDIELTGNLLDLLEFCYHSDEAFLNFSAWQRSAAGLWSWRRRNSTAGARRNVSHHYDLGNEFFAIWLDHQMLYSGAYFKNADDDLDIAQEQKLRHICAKLRLAPGKSLLDIGCGWGALGLHAARYHRVEVTGITLSEAQRTLCNQKAYELALDNQWRVRLQDYRELAGERFDRVVSVGMAEHVGRAFLPAYAAALAHCLRPGGLGVVQTMGKTTRGEVTPWITKYIFPGMYLPTLGEISDHMAAAGLHITDIENLRQHYALTLEKWIERFESNLDHIAKLFDRRFVRMWRAYLNIACAGFKFGDLNLWQISFSRGREANAPLTRDYLYQT